MASAALRAVALLALLVAAAAQCKGTQKYRLSMTILWAKATDRVFPRGASVPHTVAVTHKKGWSLFSPQKPLTRDVAAFVKTRKIGPLRRYLNSFKRKGFVAAHDDVSAKPTNIIHINVLANGDTGATQLTIMGLLWPTPDWFFGTNPIELCQGGRFIEKFPVTIQKVSMVNAYDAGLDSREKQNDPAAPTKNGVVTVDDRKTLISPYVSYMLEKGSFEGHFPFWKILVIVGCLAILLLVTFICLYPRCCKKQMVDVPVPLSDESQWAV